VTVETGMSSAVHIVLQQSVS